MISITWLGHSCFLLESAGFRILLDPYRGVQGLPDIQAEADAVYCSHDHFDHAYTEKVRLTTGKKNPFTVTEVESFHDDKGGTLRGSNKIRKFTAGGLSVAHLGDLGHPLDGAALAALGHCDGLLIPVGGYYTIDASAAKVVADAIGVRVVIPMHYRRGEMGFDVLGTVEEFTDLYPPEMVVYSDTNRFVLEEDSPEQVVVLTVKP